MTDLFSVMGTILASILLGMLAGVTPGLHPNLAASILPSMIQEPSIVLCILVTMSAVHVVVDIIPNVLLGAPDAEHVMNILPCHKMAEQGRSLDAIRISILGTLAGVIGSCILLPLVFIILPLANSMIYPYLAYILLILTLVFILAEKTWTRKVWAILVFLLSGLLGTITLDHMQEPLLPLFSGLFALPGLLLSIRAKKIIEKKQLQTTTNFTKLEPISTTLSWVGSIFSCAAITLLPSITPAQSLFFVKPLARTTTQYIFLVSSIAGAEIIFSSVSAATLHKARNGVIATLAEHVTLNTNTVVLIAALVLVVTSITTFLTLRLARELIPRMKNIQTRWAAGIVIVIIFFATLFTSGMQGIATLAVATALGLIPQSTGIARTHVMGVLMVPTLIRLFS